MGKIILPLFLLKEFGMNIKYHQLNVTNLELEKEYLLQLQTENFFIVGIEVSNPDLSLCCHLSIDPQHETANNDMTCVEYVYNNSDYLLTTCLIFENICFVTLKPDMDSVSSMAVLTMLLNGQFNLTGDLIYRLKAIAKSDRHGRANWKNRREDYFHFKDYNIYGIPIGLATMTADYKCDIDIKVQNMMEYLLTGTFEELFKYTTLTLRNIKKSNKNANFEVIIPNKLVFIKSNYRGAFAIGYKMASTVIAKNSTFCFGMGPDKKVGKKFTIAQYENNKFIDLIGLKSELNELEPGWGGSSVIIGSPQDTPSKLDDATIIELTKKYLK